MAKRKITDFFQRNTAETNDSVVEPGCHADPGGSAVELQHCELSFTCDKCSDRRGVTLMMSPLSRDMYRIEPSFPKSWLHPCTYRQQIHV